MFRYRDFLFQIGSFKDLTMIVGRGYPFGPYRLATDVIRVLATT